MSLGFCKLFQLNEVDQVLLVKRYCAAGRNPHLLEIMANSNPHKKGSISQYGGSNLIVKEFRTRLERNTEFG